MPGPTSWPAASGTWYRRRRAASTRRRSSCWGASSTRASWRRWTPRPSSDSRTSRTVSSASARSITAGTSSTRVNPDMAEPLIDLRSDTVTRPTPGMRAALAAAEVGDDVFNEDPSINRLQERVAALLGKEAALYVPSGTMSNQICIRAQTQPGDELLCDAGCHIYNFEAGGPAVLSGVTCRCIEGDHGILDVTQLEDKIRGPNDHLVRTRLVALENTHNRGGGRVYPLEKVEAISAWAHKNGLLMHLDGARLWNAIAATGIPAATWARHFDSVSVCFSKGLGAPIGSALAGTREFVAKAKRIRKLFGGGMRQAGIAAAAALYAVDHHF